MINISRLNEVLAEYKQDFIDKQWKNEKYKWEAVKCFQDNWDINTANFSEMLAHSIAKTENLLASMNYLPAAMIKSFASQAPEEVRAMFMHLYDERRDVYERIDAFKTESAVLLEKFGKGAKQHYQKENAISTYLWLRYPDTYYIYKYGEVSAVANELESSYTFKSGAYASNIRNSLLLYNELCEELQKDQELKQLLASQVTPSCYSDPELRTLTIDVGFYISRKIKEPKQVNEDLWFPKNYSPEITSEQWGALLNDKEVFTTGSLEIMRRLKDYGGMASCTQLSVKYGENLHFYLNGSVALARRIKEKTNCPILDDEENSRYWPILYIGREADKSDAGSYIWKLRDELSQALDTIDLSQVQLYAKVADSVVHGYWWLNANPKIWSFSDIAIGDVQSYTLYNDNGNKRRIFQNFLDVKAGDYLIGYESNPVKKVVALGKFVAEQDGEKVCFEKVEGLASPIDYQMVKSCPELEKMEYFINPQGSLFKLTKGEYDFILDLIREENPILSENRATPYTKVDFLNEVYMAEDQYEMLAAVLQNKKNVILQGPPGVGKTFAAKRLAYSIMEEKDENRIEFVQFHQSYSYEDFMMGYKPVNDGFELKYGIFYRFCQKAANQPEKDFFFIIDEINRGNLSRIFGELLMLLERDYRGTKATLAYNGLTFSVPQNVFIIGMMNTADRSLAMMDYALRRRFSFFELKPGFDSVGFVQYQHALHDEVFDRLISIIKELNSEIVLDNSLGKGFCIGHSYFCGQSACTDTWLQSVIQYEVLPMLNEYWFDDPNRLQKWDNLLSGVFQ